MTTRRTHKPRLYLLSAWRCLRNIYLWAIRRFKLLFRAIGLGILIIVHGDEPPKILVYKSRIAVLLRSAVHILPACITVILVTLNLLDSHGYFIGRELQGRSGADDAKLGALQVAAKTQELLILASVASIILHALRSELIYKEGLPFGLLGSERSFTQISFFWSLEFLGAVFSYDFRLWRQYYIVIGLLSFGGILAALAGPATAVLMIPKKVDWSVGGGIFWLNGSSSELWPTVLDADYLQDYNCRTDDARLNDFRCPSAGYVSLASYLSTWWNFPDAALYDVQVQDSSIRKVFYVAAKTEKIKDTWTYTANGPSANLQDATVNFYKIGLRYLRTFNAHDPPYPLSLEVAESKRFELQTQAPTVRVSCRDHLPLSLAEPSMEITFPKLNQFEPYRRKEAGVVIDIADAVRDYLSARDLLVTNGSAISLVQQAPQLLAIPLDITAGDASSLGLLILRQLGGEGKNMAAITCTVDARWAKAKSVIEATPNGDFLSHHFTRDQTRNLVKTELESSDYIQTSLQDFAPQDDGGWKHIRIRPSWFDLLSPSVSNSSFPDPSGGSRNQSYQENVSPNPDPTLLERLLDLYEFPRGDKNYPGVWLISMEVAASMFFADGLSRCGAHLHRETWWLFPAWDYNSGYNEWSAMSEQQARTMLRAGNPVETFPIPDVLAGRSATRMVVRAKFSGYAFTPTNWFDYISIALLLAHALLAVAHTIWSLWKGQTSEAWDTIPELIALSQQSPPAQPPILDNTSVGIRAAKTMGRIVTVETTEKLAGSVAPGTLQLTFRESRQERDRSGIPAVDTAYGDGEAASSEEALPLVQMAPS